MSSDGVAAAVAAVRKRIADAAARSGRPEEGVRLIAATKGQPPERIADVLACGVVDVGENRVQEAERKKQAVAARANWHLIGHLQTNKARAAATLFDAVQSIDSERVARALAVNRPADAAPLMVLIEVELTGIAGRSGVTEDAAESLLRACAGLPGVHVQGLMTIAPPVSDPDEARPYFSRLRALRDRLEQGSGWPLPDLSMGMSDDLDVAVEEGATMVRVGRAIFGSRD